VRHDRCFKSGTLVRAVVVIGLRLCGGSVEGVSSVTDMCTSVQVTQEIMSRDGGAGGGSLPRGSLPGEIACENQSQLSWT
jgi:hypothetical protein